MTQKEYISQLLNTNIPYETTVGEYVRTLEQRIAELSTPKTCETCKYWEHDKDGNIDQNLMFGECDFLGVQGKYFYCGNYEPKDNR